MKATPNDHRDKELLDLLGGDDEFAQRMQALRKCQEELEELDSAGSESSPPSARSTALRLSSVELTGAWKSPIADSEDAAKFLAQEKEVQLGNYTILRFIDQGGMGVVYEAWDNEMDRRVALKLLRSSVTLTDSSAMARFRREARLPSSLNHPGICTVYDAGVIDGTSYIAMAYLDGETLGSQLTKHKEGDAPRKQRTTPQGTLNDIIEPIMIVERVARSLHFFHEAGLVHRDIKPNNIMVTREGDPVILDFGLARGETADASTITHTGDVLGTPAYIAPEQITGAHGPPDRRCDIYSLGATLYECLTGQLPFEAPTREQLFQKILTGSPTDPRRLNPKIPKELQLVLETALERDPVLRYQTALDFAEDLRRVRCRETIRARPTSVPLRVGRWVQRNRVLTAFMATLSALLVVLLVLLYREVKRKTELNDVIKTVRPYIKKDLDTGSTGLSSEVCNLLAGSIKKPATRKGATVVRFAVYSYKQAIKMLDIWGVLRSAIERELAKELDGSALVDFVVFKNYSIGQEELLSGEQVDFMRIGPASYVKIKDEDPEVKLLAKFAHEGVFEGCIFTHTESGISGFTREQIRGRRFAFGSKSSTLGNFCPKQELYQTLGLTRKDLAASSENLGKHDKVIAAVAKREFDLGTAKKDWVLKAIADGQPLKILRSFETTPIPFAARGDLDPKIFDALQRVLLRLHESEEVLESLRTHTDATITGFSKATDADYDRVRESVRVAAEFDAER